MIDWSKHDALLISLVASHGQHWTILEPFLREHNISKHAARNRWKRINTPTPGKNKCKLCKHGHTFLTCVKNKPLNFQSETSELITKVENHSATMFSDNVYEYSISRFDYDMLQDNFYLWPDLQASHIELNA